MELINDNVTYRAGLDIAVIGLAGQFPNAGDIDTFWHRLVDGEECITFYTDEDLTERGVSKDLVTSSNFVKAKGVIKDIDLFDASFFGYTPMEAEHMDPQVRLFHQNVWHALEDSGYDPDSYSGAVGLYAGANNNFRWEIMALYNPGSKNLGAMAVSQLNDKDHMNTRISYKLNLTGPSFSLETQCSTSLVAVHLACQGLLSGECDIALAGGVSATIPHHGGYPYKEGMILSPDGHCRPFDDKAKGTVFGNGVGVAVLKRVEDAVEDGDYIYALIKGSAVNNDGGLRAGYTAPGVEGQAAVIQTALQVAQVEAESIGYIEAHGTGTELGDPIEIEALSLAFDTDKKGFCRIGSVKSNVGHLDNAAGITGMIKAVLCLNHKQIPPTLHYYTPNSRIDFDNSPFKVNNTLFQWTNQDTPRRAGVSSFGIGGTNVHIILEEAPPVQQRDSEHTGPQLLILSARTQSSLDRATIKLVDRLNREGGYRLEDVAYTLQVGRRPFRYRRMLVGETLEEVSASLAGALSDPLSIVESEDTKAKKMQVVLLRSDIDDAAPFALNQYRQTAEALCHRNPLLQEELTRALTEPGHHSKVELAFASALEQWLVHWGVSVSHKVGPGFGDLSEKDCLDFNNALFVETGPANSISRFIKDNHTNLENCRFIQLMPATIGKLTEQLGRIWLYGASVDWITAYEHREPNHRPKRVPLPGYCFDTHRYWINESYFSGSTSNGSVNSAASPLAKKDKLDDWFYIPSWERTYFNVFDTTKLKQDEDWIILAESEEGISHRMIQYLESLEHSPRVISVPQPKTIEKTINEFDTLFAKLKESEQIPSRIIYMRSIQSSGEETEYDIHFNTILQLVQAIGSFSFSSQIQLDIITVGMQAVTGNETIEPGKAMLSALFKVIPREYNNIACRLIDLENSEPDSFNVERLLSELLGSCRHPVAFRGGYRWEQSFKPFPFIKDDSAAASATAIKQGGVYLITGGLGGIGITVARHLAARYQARLILTSRSPLPGPGDDTPRAIALQELSGLGNPVKAVAVDVSDFDEMNKLLKSIASDPEFGRIDGVFHAAGVADVLGIIQRRELDANHSVMAAKVQGIRVLMKALKENNLQPSLMVLFSSLSSILGPFGEVAYTAANAYLDSLADRASIDSNSPASMRVVTIQWCAWQEVGMAVEAAKTSDQLKAALQDGLLPEQGIDAMERVLHSGFPRVAISPRDVNALLEASNQTPKPGPTLSSSRPVHPRPELVTPFAAAKSELEKEIALVIQEFLGIEKVGINDNFFELGVTSMDLVQISSRLQSAAHADVPVVTMFTYSTVATLAAHLEERG